ncbi:hypothetical protein SAMN04488688_1242 [Paenibacillus sp. cl141a]|nr:hypothetical protein SAMN04488688_1242 [Paenibacillus sp. cl141a]
MVSSVNQICFLGIKIHALACIGLRMGFSNAYSKGGTLSMRRAASYYQVSQNLLVGLFLWSFYDGGSRENVAALGAMNP